ncbi:hypothetical protein [Ferribacterium limneticum]|uniref:hypothetical protein n=1 Tax=Ferribacterium limneticum TaxID=76259 RepID=UPI001CF89A5D|nr:hypothetical protein [Ferribacterium limneticum]UCV23817.1 hypothetical protein KI613_04585 [Ferribacterium limneticum]
MGKKKESSTVVIRMFSRCEDSAWEPLSIRKGSSFMFGKTAALSWANHQVEIAVAYVDFEPNPPRLLSASLSVWRFDGNGMVNDEHASNEINRKLDMAPSGSKQRLAQLGGHDLDAVCSLLGAIPGEGYPRKE